MSDITRLLDAAAGDHTAAADLLPLVYDELRRLAAAQMAKEKPGQTLDATALVHEAYVRLVEDRGARRVSEGAASVACASGSAKQFANRRHFFAAAAEAMRRILVENARRRGSLKRGGDRKREPMPDLEAPCLRLEDDLLALDEALVLLEAKDKEAAELIKLRYFAGFTSAQAAETLGMSPRTADRTWVYARTWLLKKLEGS
jgi:RNA polymerase sigma factor (sigma-70 family)